MRLSLRRPPRVLAPVRGRPAGPPRLRRPTPDHRFARPGLLPHPERPLPDDRAEVSPMPPDQGQQANIVMWGAPACGKTTFLAALSIALNRKRNGWKVIGADTG